MQEKAVKRLIYIILYVYMVAWGVSFCKDSAAMCVCERLSWMEMEGCFKPLRWRERKRKREREREIGRASGEESV